MAKPTKGNQKGAQSHAEGQHGDKTLSRLQDITNDEGRQRETRSQRAANDPGRTADGEAELHERMLHEGEAALRLDRLRRDVHAGHLDRPARRSQDARERAQRRRLPRAVGPHEPEHRAGRDGEGEAVHRDEVAVALGELRDADHAG